MNQINLNGKFSTNMIDEINNKNIRYSKNIHVSRSKNKNNKYSTIYFTDITDSTNYKILKNIFKNELRKYLQNVESYLIIGIGNKNSNMDSLGPKTLDNILVTNHLKNYGLDKKFKLVSKFHPDVVSNTGIDTYKMIKKLINLEKIDLLILIDSLITNNLNNIARCIQISNTGITLNNHLYDKSLTEKNLKIPTILIGIPTILETDKLNIIVTTKDIDNFIKRISLLIGESINEVIHNQSFTSDVPG